MRVIQMLVEEELLAPEMARKLLRWKHSGFSVHNGKPLRRDDASGLERVAQYIIRNPFSKQKMVYNVENGTVIYRSRMHAKVDIVPVDYVAACIVRVASTQATGRLRCCSRIELL